MEPEEIARLMLSEEVKAVKRPTGGPT